MLRKLLIAAAVAVLAGQSALAAPVEITFWHSLPKKGTDAVNQIVDKFNASQSEYKLKAEYTGIYDDTTTKLQAAIPAGQAPDLMMLEVTRYGLFADSGVLEQLDPYLQKEGAEFLDQYQSFALEGPKYLGKSYVLPFNVSTPVMYYNRDAFRAAGLDPNAPPKTWDELRQMSAKLTVRQGNDVKQWGVIGLGQFVRWAFVAQAGGEWVSPKDNSVLMDSDASIGAYTYMADLIRKDKVSPEAAAINESLGSQYFTSGQAAINFDSTGGFGALRGAVKFDLGVAPLPCGVKCAAPIGGATIGINSASDEAHRKGAWAFLKFISRPEINAITFVETGYLPIMKKTADVDIAKKAIAEEPGYSVAIKQLDVAFVRSRPPAMPAIRAKEPSVWEAIVLGKTPEAQALKTFGAEMRTMLSKSGG
ncbi:MULTISPECIES: ABC transporter substrate-binding protein [unclassified Neorhizobium]|uniref:ABC transporter substrate-binding protein n=1 Tax=unclassified Neorhizobium TaxID=2629175 RepID=UPI001FF43BFF|nr:MULTISPECIES: ABC transporter substrate-binding protein [unclassified Neorhizobium]MCJ9671866.1 ABC transporter substrate-binding protein [Neorhizobium sp. SHOUNA12B]MCJ9747901.1 ABC transporter substrate-binding protein [Neorhizobium sp. SHOUNA12A]